VIRIEILREHGALAAAETRTQLEREIDVAAFVGKLKAADVVKGAPNVDAELKKNHNEVYRFISKLHGAPDVMEWSHGPMTKYSALTDMILRRGTSRSWEGMLTKTYLLVNTEEIYTEALLALVYAPSEVLGIISKREAMEMDVVMER
tara:strand:+ start:49 stop:492 length:444 start_codon:yes stop_codon:yes gene_type:complete